jgi:Fanconi anemia group M protein
VFVEHPLLKANAIEIRDYQVNIAQSCLKRSTLVVLPTGMGKTIVALEVIAEILRREGGRILFLAPTKPLVEQHAATLGELLLKDDIAIFTGEVKPEDREELWAENKIITSTPQVIKNDLEAGRITLNDVSLIVFDETHRAVGDYAYVNIGEGTTHMSTSVTTTGTRTASSWASPLLPEATPRRSWKCARTLE